MAQKEGGLTQAERAIMHDLRRLQEDYLKLEPQHPNERLEFTDGVHRLSGIMALRAARAAFPDLWPTYGQDPNGKWVIKK